MTQAPAGRTPTRPAWPDVARPLLDEFGLSELTPDMARAWCLVLLARRVPHRVRQGHPGLLIQVPPAREAEALAELRDYLRETPSEPVVLPDFRKPGFTWGELPGVLWTLGLATVFLTMTGAENTPGAFGLDWQTHGYGDTGLMASGQWWRAVTALTLHADVSHLMGNVCLGGTFLVVLAAQTGLGAAWFLSLAGGVLGNLAKVPLQAANYRFIGSSTMVFSSLGVLAGVRLLRFGPAHRWKRALPFAAGLMLLAFFGAGGDDQTRQIDLAGHALGFASGFVLGVAWAGIEKATKKSGRPLSPWLGKAAAAICALAWTWAFLA